MVSDFVANLLSDWNFLLKDYMSSNASIGYFFYTDRLLLDSRSSESVIILISDCLRYGLYLSLNPLWLGSSCIRFEREIVLADW